MQAALRASAGELVRGASTGFALWAGSHPCAVCQQCPACVCQPSLYCGAKGEVPLEFARSSGGSFVIPFLLGVISGVFATLIVVTYLTVDFCNAGLVRGPSSGSSAGSSGSPRTTDIGVGIRLVRGARGTSVAPAIKGGIFGGVLGD